MAGRYRYYKRKLYFSTRDRILLHLLDFVGHEDQFQQPDDLTQFGIAEAIALGRSTVSKAIRRLAKDRLVRGMRAHVPSGKLRRTVYLLTPAGVAEANRRKREVEEEIVTFRDGSGQERALRMAEAPKLLPEYATLLDVSTHVSEGVFDASTFQARRTGKFVDMTERAPRLRYFFGRESELEAVDRWLASPTERVLVVSGITGIGKTTLISRKLDEWRGSRHLFFYRIMPWTALRNVVHQLSELLGRLSRKGLGQYLEAKKEDIDLDQVASILAEDLAGTNCVLVFDDYHNAKAPVPDFFAAMRAALESVEGPKIIVAGRNVTPFYDRREVRVKQVVRELPLPGLDAASAQKLLGLRNLGLTAEAMRKLHETTGGHPLFLELVDSADLDDATDINKYLEEEMFSRLTEGDLKALTVASLFRTPVHVDALYVDDEVSPAIVRGLLDQSLLREVSANVYEVHDVVRTFIFTRMTPRQRRGYHRWAAQFHLSQVEPNYLEALHHLVEGEDATNAARIAVKEGRAILRRGESEELLGLVDRMIPAVEDPSHSAELLLLKAQILDVRGEIDLALSLFGEILRLPIGDSLASKVADAHRAVGDILRRQGNLGDAERHLEAAFRIFRDHEQWEGQASTILTMGSLAEDRSDFPRAYRQYEKAVEIARSLGLPALEANAHFAASRILASKGDFQGALSRKRLALHIAEGLADWHLQARFQVSLGATLQDLDHFDESLNAYNRSIETSRRIGDLRMLAYGLYNVAGLLLRTSDFLRTEAALKEAEGLSAKLREPVMDALIQTLWGAFWEKRGKWQLARRSLDDGLSRLRNGGHDMDYARHALTAAHMYRRNGEGAEALRLLQDALAIGRRLRATAIVEQCQRYLVEYSKPTAGPSPAQPDRDAVPTP